MSVGVQALDDDHKILVGCLNDFIDACENDEGILVTDSIFSILLDYTGYHFAREEKVMEVCGYKGLAAHKELHQALAEKVVENRTRFVLNRDGELDEEVRQFLLHWLQKHILGCDMDYASDCAGKEKEIAAALESR
ncbi:MAG: hemerythrin family protein, partial [Rhodospirillales bacterium]|nr:hemerythrin family protein [Rhodospirillales bacterium]